MIGQGPGKEVGGWGRFVDPHGNCLWGQALRLSHGKITLRKIGSKVVGKWGEIMQNEDKKGSKWGMTMTGVVQEASGITNSEKQGKLPCGMTLYCSIIPSCSVDLEYSGTFNLSEVN